MSEQGIFTKVYLLLSDKNFIDHRYQEFFTEKRVELITFTNLDEILKVYSKEPPDALCISMNYQHQKVVLIPSVFMKYGYCKVITFAEINNNESLKKVAASHADYKISGKLSVNSLWTKIRSSIKAAESDEKWRITESKYQGSRHANTMISNSNDEDLKINNTIHIKGSLKKIKSTREELDEQIRNNSFSKSELSPESDFEVLEDFDRGFQDQNDKKNNYGSEKTQDNIDENSFEQMLNEFTKTKNNKENYQEEIIKKSKAVNIIKGERKEKGFVDFENTDEDLSDLGFDSGDKNSGEDFLDTQNEEGYSRAKQKKKKTKDFFEEENKKRNLFEHIIMPENEGQNENPNHSNSDNKMSSLLSEQNDFSEESSELDEENINSVQANSKTKNELYHNQNNSNISTNALNNIKKNEVEQAEHGTVVELESEREKKEQKEILKLKKRGERIRLEKEIVNRLDVLEKICESSLKNVFDTANNFQGQFPLIKVCSVIPVNDSSFKGLLIVATNTGEKINPDQLIEFRTKISELAKQQNIFGIEDSFTYQVEPINILDWASEQSEFSIIQTMPGGEEIFVSFVLREKIIPNLKNYIDHEMYLVDVQHLPPETEVDFDAYIHLPKNGKYIQYLKKGKSISLDQVKNLMKNNVSAFCLPADEKNNFKKFFVRKAIEWEFTSFNKLKKIS